MPCNSVATVKARMTLPLAQLAAFPGALDALVVALGDRRVTESRMTVADLKLVVDGVLVVINPSGRVTCQSWRLGETVKAAFEQVQAAVLVELARQQIAASARVTNERQIGDQLVLTVEL